MTTHYKGHGVRLTVGDLETFEDETDRPVFAIAGRLKIADTRLLLELGLVSGGGSAVSDRKSAARLIAKGLKERGGVMEVHEAAQSALIDAIVPAEEADEILRDTASAGEKQTPGPSAPGE